MGGFCRLERSRRAEYDRPDRAYAGRTFVAAHQLMPQFVDGSWQLKLRGDSSQLKLRRQLTSRPRSENSRVGKRCRYFG
jgi:hypothetical protein